MISISVGNTILFVHKDGSFQDVVAGLLTGSGHGLITASDGADALRKASAFDGAIQLLLAAVELPGMTGMELAIQFNRERPDTKILLISELDSGILTLHKNWQFLPKPFVASLLRDKIRDLLSEQESSQIASSGPSSPKTILFAEGKGLRQSVAASLRRGDWQVIVAGTGAEALRKAADFAGTIHLLAANLDIADMPGVELAQRLHAERPGMETLLFSAVESGTLILGDVWHFLPVPFETEILRLEIIGLLERTNQLNGRYSTVGISSQKLTQREVQVLKLIAGGSGTKQIAARLGIAFKTAVGHRSSLMKKLDIHDIAGLVHYAIRAGLIHS
jgi:DNA-binding NarL/FixJ family response regulator